VDLVRELLEIDQVPKSLDDFIPDRASGKTEQELFSAELRALIHQALNRPKLLTEEEKKVLMMKYGFDPYEEDLNFTEIGRSFDLGRDRIRQIHAKALQKLRKTLPVEQLL